MPTWRMLCIGSGPGPKNVLAERDDGFRLVVPYAVWKHKLSKETAIATYKTLVGFVQFDPNEREAAGQQIKDFVIVPANSNGEQVRVTLWPELAGADITRGTGVLVQGKFTTANKNGKTYFNLSATDLVVFSSTPKATDEVVNPVEEEDEDFDPGF